jgi:C1A family cysteine protease
MPITGLLAATLAFFNATSTTPSFSQWVVTYNRSYSSLAELAYRREVYETNLMRIEAHNALPNQTWTMAVNKFADLTAEEFRSRFVGRMSNGPYRGIHTNFSMMLRGAALPTSVDWTTKGAVTPVKNQQQCGSCWAFSTTGSVEGAWFLAKGQLVSLSEQQLVDCSSAQGNQGCNGGLMDYAFQYIIDNKGICSEASYPYTAADGTCKKCTPVATISGFKDVPANSETALLTAIAQQPVSVAVEADQSSFQFYSGGVMTAPCGTQLDHGVLAVGYGTDNSSGLDYYKVKNSWGADWGMAGYILLGRGAKFGASGQCGIQMQPSYPVV